MAQDSDGDGVADGQDAFPCDSTFAGVAYAPGEGAHGGLLFEDQWPHRGDLDFNDLALTYNYVFFLDGQGRVVQLDATFSALAVGGRFDNGLALTLPTAGSAVGSVTRSVGRQTAEALALSSTDSQATVVLASNLRALFNDTAGPINADPGQPRLDGASLEVSIMFSTPVSLPLGEAPFDVFIFRSADPTHEIHRPSYGGSSQMNAGLFGTADDGSGASRKFVDTSGLPFVLLFPDTVPYPAEGVAISSLYPAITTFASSGGAQAADFFTSPVVQHAYKDVAGQGPLSPVALSPLSIDQSCVPVLQTTMTFDYTGAPQAWVVPSGVTSVRIEALGAPRGATAATAPSAVSAPTWRGPSR